MRFIAISAGGDHSLALAEDGTIMAWGRNYYGQIDIPKSDKRFSRLEGVGIDQSSRLEGVGIDQSSRPEEAGTSSHICEMRFIAISTGAYHSLALAEDGTILAWGDNMFGQLNVPKSDKRFIAISAGNIIH